MTRSLDRRLAKLEAQSPTTAADQQTARPSRRVVASRLLLEEALVLRSKPINSSQRRNAIACKSVVFWLF